MLMVVITVIKTTAKTGVKKKGSNLILNHSVNGHFINATFKMYIHIFSGIQIKMSLFSITKLVL